MTEANLYASERFWPYRVALVEPWQPEGREAPLRPDEVGVLVRVEASGGARIDFGSRGKYVVPVSKTDLVRRANAIRLGDESKDHPNFVQAIRTRLLDSSTGKLMPLAVETADASTVFLCAFADPEAPGFAERAADLAPLREQPGLLTVFFPLGRHSDASVRAQLRENGWEVPFLPDFLAEGYARSLLDDDAELPALLLQTREGRVVFQGPWKPDAGAPLTQALAAVAAGAAPVPAP